MPDEPTSTEPDYGVVADDEDQLGWSWDELTDGERTEDTDVENLGVELFAGVPEDQIAEHKRLLEELGSA